MSDEVLAWMKEMAGLYLATPGDVLEVGAQDINGSVRPIIEPLANSYWATDMEAGKGVDAVLNNEDLLTHFGAEAFNTVIACEVLEHDKRFWMTVETLRQLVIPGGHLILTVPTFGFPLHRYPRDYWRFGEDSYTDVFFDEWEILDICHLDNPYAPAIALAGIARKPL